MIFDLLPDHRFGYPGMSGKEIGRRSLAHRAVRDSGVLHRDLGNEGVPISESQTGSGLRVCRFFGCARQRRPAIQREDKQHERHDETSRTRRHHRNLSGVTAVRADDDDSNRRRNAYDVTNLVSNFAKTAAVQDPVLQNAWGVAFTPAASPFWIADNATGCSTLYNGDGTKVAREVSIPLPGDVVPSTDCVAINPKTNSMPAAPTG